MERLEMDESEYKQSSFDDSQLLMVLDALGQGEKDKLLHDGDPSYSYKQIMETGSDELKELVFLVTGGYVPGNASSKKSGIME